MKKKTKPTSELKKEAGKTPKNPPQQNKPQKNKTHKLKKPPKPDTIIHNSWNLLN